MADCGPRKEDLLAKGEAYCRQAKALGADIALFPELWYVSDHHFVERSWSHDYELWRGKHLWGEAEWHPGQEFAEQIGRWHAQAIDGDDPYLLHFQSLALETAQGPVKVGAMICYDREFPESARMLMLGGAELILVPNVCDMELNFIAQVRTRAIENMVALANYAPPDANGHSIAFDPIAFTEHGSRDSLVV